MATAQNVTTRRAVIQGAALATAAAALAAVPVIAEAAADDPLSELVARWLPLHAAHLAAERDYDRRIGKLRKLGLPDVPRVRLMTHYSNEDDQGVTTNYAYTEEQIRKWIDIDAPEEWRPHQDHKLNIFHQIKARWTRTRDRLGIPAAEQRLDAAEAARAELEWQIIDTAQASLAGVIAKLRCSLALEWNDDKVLGGPTLEDQAPYVRAIAEAIAFLDPLVGKGGAAWSAQIYPIEICRRILRPKPRTYADAVRDQRIGQQLKAMFDAATLPPVPGEAPAMVTIREILATAKPMRPVEGAV